MAHFSSIFGNKFLQVLTKNLCSQIDCWIEMVFLAATKISFVFRNIVCSAVMSYTSISSEYDLFYVQWANFLTAMLAKTKTIENRYRYLNRWKIFFEVDSIYYVIIIYEFINDQDFVMFVIFRFLISNR